MKPNLRKISITAAGAIFLEPLLNSFAPSVKPLVLQLVQSNETKKLLESIAKSAGETGSGVFVEFLAGQVEKLQDALTRAPKLDEAMIVALRQAFRNMRDDLRRRNRHNILISFDQFFADWDKKLKEIQEDDLLIRETLEAKQFALSFYERPRTKAEGGAWWPPLKAELEAWIKGGSIPPELEEYLKQNHLSFAHDALTSTLGGEPYKEVWDEFHRTLGMEILTTLKEFEKHIRELRNLAGVAAGEFLQGAYQLDFTIRKPTDDLVEELATKEIYIQREVQIAGQEGVKVTSLHDIIERDGYFLLAAPAGSGKSTMMSRWIRDFLSSPQTSSNTLEPKICYYFYNKREGTSDYIEGLTVLSDQLLRAHLIQANVNNINRATTRSIILNALKLDHPIRLVVIVDGLDEVVESQTVPESPSPFRHVFPSKLGKNTTVILTLRDDEGANTAKHYRRELGLPLKALVLPGVKEAALASYLSSAHNDNLKKKAHEHDFIKRIVTKTEGLAIYVHYLLEELSKTSEAQWEVTINELPEGFENYVSKSLPAALDGKPQWEEALSFLALTRSSLAEQDLLMLTKLSGNKLKKSNFDGVSWNIKRWLRKDGNKWSFSHQKIGEVFYKRYVSSDRATYMEYLLAYCADWKRHESHYVLQNYATLLSQEQRGDELYRVASDKGFLDSQRDQLADNPNAPLHTLQVAMRYAAETNDAAMMTRFLLMHAALVSELAKESWLEAYNRRGYLGALELADNFGDNKSRVIWYLLTAWKLLASDEKEKAEAVLRRLGNSPLTTELKYGQLEIVEALLPLFQNIDIAPVRPIFRKAIILRLVEGSFNNAVQLAPSDKSERAYQPTLGELFYSVSNLVKSGKYKEAEDLFDNAERSDRSIEDANERQSALDSFASALAHLASALAQSGKYKEADELFGEAERIARSLNDGGTFALRELASAFVRSQRFDEAERIALSLEYSDQSDSLAALASALADAQQFDKADRIIHLIKDNSQRSAALTNLASASAQSGEHEEADRLFSMAEQVARSIEYDRDKGAALATLASALAQSGEHSKADELFDEVERMAHSLDDFVNQSTVLKDLAVALTHAQKLDEARRITHSIQREVDWWRAYALTKLALALARSGKRKDAEELFDEVEQIAHSMDVDWHRNPALSHLAGALVMSGRFEDALTISAQLSGSYLLSVLDEFIKANRPSTLKKFLVSLSYDMYTALQAVARMIDIYQDQAEKIYREVRQSMKELSDT
jgi:tetratricopeptide (TPR) repeat protein